MAEKAEDIRKAVDDYSDEAEEGLLIADGLDAAIIGVGRRCGQPDVVVYSIPKAVECLVKQGMTREDAEEYLEFNSVGAWVGEKTPVWMTPIEDLMWKEEDHVTAERSERTDRTEREGHTGRRNRAG